MIGDRLLIYNERTGEFYGGRDQYWKVYANKKAPPKWLPTPKGAVCGGKLKDYKRICTELGDGVRVISETKARQIMLMRARKDYLEVIEGV